MTLQQLRYFLATAESGSFSAAAERLRMAQPSLSEQVRRLEGELGAALFVRAGRRLELTEAGRALRPEAERALAAANAARDAVIEVRELRGGTVSFGTFGSARHYLLADLVADFRRRHPAVATRVVGQNSVEVAAAVRAGRLEAGLVILPVPDEGLDVRPLVRDEVLVASADAGRTRHPATAATLVEAPLILYDARYGWDDPTRRQLLVRAQEEGVRLTPAIEVEELDAALELAARGLGDTIVTRVVAGGRRFPRALSTVPFADPIFDVIAVVSRRGVPLSRATRELVALAETRAVALGEPV